MSNDVEIKTRRRSGELADLVVRTVAAAGPAGMRAVDVRRALGLHNPGHCSTALHSVTKARRLVRVRNRFYAPDCAPEQAHAGTEETAIASVLAAIQ